jgi:fructose-1,6-bisphosphatase/inositol monophosphatase family enzyme
MLDIVTELLADAGQVLIAHRSAERTIERKSSQWTLVSDADCPAEEYMIDDLRRLAPDDAILSEECGFHPGRSKRTWVLDPLDGTTNFVAGLDVAIDKSLSKRLVKKLVRTRIQELGLA